MTHFLMRKFENTSQLYKLFTKILFCGYAIMLLQKRIIRTTLLFIIERSFTEVLQSIVKNKVYSSELFVIRFGFTARA